MLSRSLLRMLRPLGRAAGLGGWGPRTGWRSVAVRPFATGKQTETKEFKAETKKLLEIVAKSLYTDKEVFLRELLSNASDALEKQRLKDPAGSDRLGVSVSVSETKHQIAIEDNGVGMSRQELVDNLGTIARSGSKEFVERLQKEGGGADNIIGQFGVGFYSSFIVADYVEVVSKPQHGTASVWSSDGSGSYEVGDTADPGLERGTRITLHLRADCRQFGTLQEVRGVIQKYSNFINYPIAVNGEKLNLVKAIWARDRREVSEEEYQQFYAYLTGRKEDYFAKLHYSADVPLSIRALVYVPSTHLEKFGMGQEKSEVSLYCRKVLIKKNCRELLPNYLRFLKGVVDCEDIPLNISRENYQDSALVAKLRNVVAKRVIRHLKDEAEKRPEQYLKWYEEFEVFLKEGTMDFENKKDMIELNRFECNVRDGWVSLRQYVQELKKANQDAIFYMFAPSKQITRNSPFLEPYSKAQLPVLLVHTHIDEAIFKDFGEYEGLRFSNIETSEEDLSKYIEEVRHDEAKGIKAEDLTTFPLWIKSELQPFVSKVVVSRKSISSPALVISPVSISMRQMRMMMQLAEKMNMVLDLRRRTAWRGRTCGTSPSRSTPTTRSWPSSTASARPTPRRLCWCSGRSSTTAASRRASPWT